MAYAQCIHNPFWECSNPLALRPNSSISFHIHKPIDNKSHSMHYEWRKRKMLNFTWTFYDIQYLFFIRRFEYKFDRIRIVLCCHRESITVVGIFESFCNVSQIHTHQQITIATVLLETTRVKSQQYQWYVWFVYTMKLNRNENEQLILSENEFKMNLRENLN